MEPITLITEHGRITLGVFGERKSAAEIMERWKPEDKMPDETTKFVTLDGKPAPSGQTVTVDHCVQEFRVVVRSMSNITPERLKDIIQQRLEVVSCELTDETVYCRIGALDTLD